MRSTPFRLNRTHACSALMAMAMLVAACSGSSSSPRSAPPTATTSTSTASYEPRYAENPCDPSVPQDRRVVCGTLTVPEDRARPDGHQIELAVATIHPAAHATDPAPIVFLMGGPGFSALANVGDFLTRDFGSRNVIVFDQRGSGLSTPSLACAGWNDTVGYAVHATGDLEERRSITASALKACRDQLVGDGIDLDQYNLAADVSDMEDLRVAMKIRTWDVWGMSYGSRFALEAARTHSKTMRSVILESAFEPGSANFDPEYVTNGLRQLFDGCAANPACRAKYPSLEADFHDAVTKLNASPHHGTITDPLGHQHPTVITGGDALVMFWFLQELPSLTPILPSMIEAIRRGDASFLDAVAQVSLPGDGYSRGADLSYECADDGSPTDIQATLAAHPEYNSVLSVDVRTACDLWDVPRLPASYRQPVTVDVPTLILAGEYDPNTPPHSGRRLADRLPHATFVEFPGMGHTPTFPAGDRTACPRSIMKAFLDAPRSALSTACVATMSEPSWT